MPFSIADCRLQNVQRLAMLCQFMLASLQSPGPLFEANWQGKAQGAKARDCTSLLTQPARAQA